mgnify:CR=1 FL=1
METETQAPERQAPKRDQEGEPETRVDERAKGVFSHLGFKGRLPDQLVRIYLDYKRTKDRIQPGTLSAEGYAAVVTLFTLTRS